MEAERRWEELPIDCFLTILNKLTLEEKKLSVPFVCKSWYEALLLPQFWKVLNFYPLYVKSWDSFAERFMQQYNLRSFSFSGFLKLLVRRSQGSAEEIIFHHQGGTWEDLLYVSNECPALRILVLPDLRHECDFSMLAGKWNDLERLYIGEISLPFEEALLLISQHFKNLSGLQFDGSIGEDNSVLSSLSLLPNLKYLCLSGVHGLSIEGLHLILDGCKKLEELYIRNATDFQVDEAIIGKSSGIRTFVFDNGYPPEKLFECEYPYLRFEYGRLLDRLMFHASKFGIGKIFQEWKAMRADPDYADIFDYEYELFDYEYDYADIVEYDYEYEI
ncbi:F-box/LRR-repeat protein-like [Iris pallida]|uniref:F-box/LRR-repeat protein-like n=1 Tax=Iris pallida TaxID=29817 RepID=A0AAX6E3N4_IRIPA|nr:F-box/LRR-repeat protein-like [Iris pallida]KAJ6838125.1 F-box/LRR-repeat protein-like [Iris pallida]